CLPALAVVSLLSTSPLALAGEVTGPDIPIGPSAHFQNDPAIAVTGDHAVAVWFDYDRGPYVACAFTLDGGATWAPGSAPQPQEPPGNYIEGLPSICAASPDSFFLSVQAGRLINFGGYTTIAVYAGSLQGGQLSWSEARFAVPLVGIGLYGPYESSHLTWDDK